jgi:hypothetical protein
LTKEKKMNIKTKRKKTYINVSSTSNSKQIICDLLCKAIQATSAGDDLQALRFDPKTEIVHVDFITTYDARQINVAKDSGWAMIKDIVNHINIG